MAFELSFRQPNGGIPLLLFAFIFNDLRKTNRILMDLLTPGAGLIIWQIFVAAAMALTLIAWVMIAVSSALKSTNKILWLAITLLPVIGATLFFIALRRIPRYRSNR